MSTAYQQAETVDVEEASKDIQCSPSKACCDSVPDTSAYVRFDDLPT
jgi:hypothetical protein